MISCSLSTVRINFVRTHFILGTCHRPKLVRYFTTLPQLFHFQNLMLFSTSTLIFRFFCTSNCILDLNFLPKLTQRRGFSVLLRSSGCLDGSGIIMSLAKNCPEPSRFVLIVGCFQIFLVRFFIYTTFFVQNCY